MNRSVNFFMCLGLILLSGCYRRADQNLVQTPKIEHSSSSIYSSGTVSSHIESWSYKQTDLANNLELPLPDNFSKQVVYHAISIEWKDKSEYYKFNIGVDMDAELMLAKKLIFLRKKECENPAPFKVINEIKNEKLILTRMQSTACSNETQFRLFIFPNPYFISPAENSTNDQIDLIEQILSRARIGSTPVPNK